MWLLFNVPPKKSCLVVKKQYTPKTPIWIKNKIIPPPPKKKKKPILTTKALMVALSVSSVRGNLWWSEVVEDLRRV